MADVELARPVADDAAGLSVSDPFESGPLRFLPSPIRRSTSALRSIGAGWATAFFPSIALSALAAALAPDLGRPEFPAGGALLIFLLVVFSPFFETLIMVGALELLRRFLSPTVAVLASAALWAIAHSLAAPAWGLVIWWPFLIFSTLYLAWHRRGKMRAIGVVATTHALQNLPVALILLQR